MSASASLTAPKNSGPEVRQFQFGTGAHDSTQYNFFAGDKVFSGAGDDLPGHRPLLGVALRRRGCARSC